MAENLTLTNLTNLNNGASVVSAINANNAAIETAFTDVLSRSGTSPNQMTANLDMNSNRILNLPSPTNATEPLRLVDVATPPQITILTSASATAANTIYAGPTSGAAQIPTFRALVPADLGAIAGFSNVNRTAKAISYTILAADLGATVAMTSDNLDTVTLTAASGYPSNFICVVTNESSVEAKIIAFNGITNFFLWPKQSLQVWNSGNIWHVMNEKRWKVPSSLFLYVNQSTGNDSNSGLTTSTAFATVQAAVNSLISNFDCNGFMPFIQLASGQTVAESLSLGMVPVGVDQFTIIGDINNISNYNWNPPGNSSAINARDLTIVTVKGITFGSIAGSGAGLLIASQMGVMDIGWCNFSNNSAGTCVQASESGNVNFIGPIHFTTTVNATNFINVTGPGRVSAVAVPFNFDVGSVAFTNFINMDGGRLDTSGSPFTFGGTGLGSASAKKYTLNDYAVANFSSPSWPAGFTAGSATNSQANSP